jgi:hypothetical protein
MKPKSILLFSILYLLSSLLLIAASGCIAAGVFAHKVIGPLPVPAKYVPAKEPLVVMVENYRQPSSAYTDDELLSRYIEGFLKGHQVAPVGESAKVRELRMDRPNDFKNMSVAAVGREVGAKQVLYVDVVNNELETLMAGESLRGTTAVRVKVVDTNTGETLWPADMADGYPLQQGVQFGKSKARSEIELKQGLYATLGDKIAKLFYKWKPDEEEAEGFVADQ